MNSVFVFWVLFLCWLVVNVTCTRYQYQITPKSLLSGKRQSCAMSDLTSGGVLVLPSLASCRFRGGRRYEKEDNIKQRVKISRSGRMNSVMQRIAETVQSLFDSLVSKPLSTILTSSSWNKKHKYRLMRSPSIIVKKSKRHKDQKARHQQEPSNIHATMAGSASSTGTVQVGVKAKLANHESKKRRATMTPPTSFKASYISSSQNRIINEMRRFLADPPENCKLLSGTTSTKSWIVEMTGINGTIYSGEQYRLKMIFPSEYPAKPPSVYFLQPTPRHVHVYSNGDICLSILGPDWRPSMSAQLVVTSILSMISSAKEKKLPEGNAMHSENAPGGQQNEWMYHDDRC